MDSGIQKSLPSRAQIETWARDLGFQAIGITDVDLSAHTPYVRAYLQANLHGDMGYLARNLDKRLQPDLLEPWTLRVISARMNYLSAEVEPLDVLEDASKAYISRYALGRDYHKVLRKRLAKLATRIDQTVAGFKYRAFTDSAPVLEKALGAKAGLGWMGKHTLLLDKKVGSWFFLGEIYTNAPLAIDQDEQEDLCGKCSACMTVCPTDAIVSAKVLDARRCIAYLTIEHKGSIPEALRKKIGNRVFGCDDCQLFCPWNKDAPVTDESDFKPRHGLEAPELLDLFLLSEDEFLRITEGSAIRRINYEQWRRNLAIGIGNGPSSEQAMRTLQGARSSASPMLAEHIDWALQQLTERAQQGSN